MVSISVQDNDIICDIRGSDSFAGVVTILKTYRCKFVPSTKKWSIPLFRYDHVIDELQNIEVLSISEADEKALARLKEYPGELRLSPERLTFQQSLLKYPPFQGKHPYEDYQKQDILRAINRNRYGLFLDMGLGKAYIAAAIIAHLRHYNKANKVLLISSNIGAANMVHELKKFVTLNNNEIISMTRVGKDRDLFKPEASIVVTNYNTFRVLCDYYYKKKNKNKEPPKKMAAPVMPIEEWLGGKPGILLLDESHALGNPSSQQTSRILLHSRFFEYRYLFTGSPADKNEKLYAQLRILDPALTHNLSYQDWIQEYNETGNYFSAYAINPDKWRYEKLQELNARVTKNYAVYRNSEDHLELPENYKKKLYVELSPMHREIYQAFVKSTLEDIRTRTGRLRSRDVVNAFPYMQMALDNPKKLLIDHPSLLTPELAKVIQQFSFDDHRKTEILLDILAEKVGENNEKGIIWIWHPSTAERLMHLLKKYNPISITGETGKGDEQERMAMVEDFKKDPDKKILIASIPVLNTSITVIEATFQVYLERVYNYAQYTQSLKRIHRIGQTKNVITYIPIWDETIDVALDANLETKDTLNTKILSKEFLSLEEWKTIFNMTEETSVSF